MLWLLTFVLFSVVFGAAAFVWWRLDAEKQKQRFAENVRSASDPGEVSVRRTVLMEQPKADNGVGSLFQARPESRDKREGATAQEAPRQKAQWMNGRILLMTAALGITGAIVGSQLDSILGPAARFIAAGVAAALPALYRSKQRNNRMTALEEQFPEALDFVSRSIRAGNAFSVGLELLAAEAVEPLKSEILIVTREMALGAPLDDALQGLTERVPLVEVRFFVSAVLLQRETGGNLSEVLGKLSASVRERLRLRSHVKAASGQGRLTATVLSILPIATLLALRALSPGYIEGMTEDPLGRNLLAAAAVSEILGFIVMKKIIKIEV